MVPADPWQALESEKQLERAQQDGRDVSRREEGDRGHELPEERRPQEGGVVEPLAGGCGCCRSCGHGRNESASNLPGGPDGDLRLQQLEEKGLGRENRDSSPRREV